MRGSEATHEQRLAGSLSVHTLGRGCWLCGPCNHLVFCRHRRKVIISCLPSNKGGTTAPSGVSYDFNFSFVYFVFFVFFMWVQASGREVTTSLAALLQEVSL